jgi:hypothetical protein
MHFTRQFRRKGMPKGKNEILNVCSQARIRNPELIEINPTFRKPPPILGAFYDYSAIENTLRHTRN